MTDNLNQAVALIQRAKNILIVPVTEFQGDSISSALALFFTLKKLGKNANLFLAEKIPEKLQFLANPQAGYPQDCIITINTAQKEVSKMYYEKNEKDIKIHLAINGELKEQDISLLSAGNNIEGSQYDLTIVLGARSLDDVGEAFEKHPRLFYESQILNIDNHPLNENFGEVNLIDVSSSLAETAVDLIKSLDPEGKNLDEETATCLLTGVIYASQNFRNPKTRPKTFETSAFLIKKGAEHQKILQHLYKQKDISQIRLLGRILEKINFKEEKELYIAALTEKDFQECQASSKDLAFAAEELKLSFRHLPNLLILWESIILSSRPELSEKILDNFEGISKRSGTLFLIRDCSLNSAQEKLLQII